MHRALTMPAIFGRLRFMAQTLHRLDPERRRRRLRVLAELADAKALRDRLVPRQVQAAQMRDLIEARRRRVSGWT
jgi:hypothetical protein